MPAVDATILSGPSVTTPTPLTTANACDRATGVADAIVLHAEE